MENFVSFLFIFNLLASAAVLIIFLIAQWEKKPRKEEILVFYVDIKPEEDFGDAVNRTVLHAYSVSDDLNHQGAVKIVLPEGEFSYKTPIRMSMPETTLTSPKKKGTILKYKGEGSSTIG